MDTLRLLTPSSLMLASLVQVGSTWVIIAREEIENLTETLVVTQFPKSEIKREDVT